MDFAWLPAGSVEAIAPLLDWLRRQPPLTVITATLGLLLLLQAARLFAASAVAFTGPTV